MKCVFISQPMANRSDEEIKAEREKITQDLTEALGDIEIVDSFFEGAPHDANPLWFLAKSLEKLSTADCAYFAPGWNTARGCFMEHEACVQYGIKIVGD